MWLKRLEHNLNLEQQRWFHWIPVCFGIGITLYFNLLLEPDWIIIGAIFLLAIACVLIPTKSALSFALSGILLWISLGFINAKLRTFYIQAPIIEKEGRGYDIEGWVEQIQQRKPTGIKITLYVTAIKNKEGTKLLERKRPVRIRISFVQKNIKVNIGDHLGFKAILFKPPSPVWPGGFDYARRLWFQQIGASGFAISKPGKKETNLSPPSIVRFQNEVSKLRASIRRAILQNLPNNYGHLAVALITGDRSGMSEKDLEALRSSGLAHILAISGLHMAIMAGTIYWFVRGLLAAFPVIALRFPIKKIAALLALTGGMYYLIISGAAISTQRAYIMVAIMFIAVICNRSAVTLRNVAMAALVILAIRPESVLDVGFQMSFAAATALVAIYESITRDIEKRRAEGQIVTKIPVPVFRYILSVTTTTMIASIAVSPFSAYHFNQFTLFSILSNILAMPIIGFVIMPMALITLLVMPIGLEFGPLLIMQSGIDWLIGVSEYVSELPFALIYVRQIPDISISLIAFGGCWLAIWLNKWRYYGLFFIAFGLLLAPTLRLPDILVDREGKIIAVQNQHGKLEIPNLRAGKFSLKKWKKLYADNRPLKQIKKESKFRCDSHGCTHKIKNHVISYIYHPSALMEDCIRSDILISKLRLGKACTTDKFVIDKTKLSLFGAHAIYLYDNHIDIKTVEATRSNRPWGRLFKASGTRTGTY